MPTLVKTRNRTIDVLKGLAIVLVVYGHVIQRSMVVGGADFFLNPVFKIIYTFHMPLFVFISGYLIAASLKRRSIKDTFTIRVKSLFIPFVVWSLLDMVVNDLINSSGGFNVFEYLFLKPSVWFLFTLFVASALVLASVKLQRKFGLVIFALIYLLILFIPFNEYAALYYIKWFYLFYVAGYLIHEYGSGFIARFNNTATFVTAFFIFFVLLPFWTRNDYIYVNKMHFLSADYVLEILRYGYVYLIGFVGIVLAFFIGAHLARTKTVSLLGNIGIYSLDIYLLQRYLVEGLYPKILTKFNLSFDYNSPLFLCVFCPLVAVIAVAVCIFVTKLLIRRIDILNTLLLGHR
ncbi:MAG: acyltransferase family protein [Candidatus Omnitrophica bacterium]|nr:acyltransferase family protein [Candidatus Omnitrophota bacterium]